MNEFILFIVSIGAVAGVSFVILILSRLSNVETGLGRLEGLFEAFMLVNKPQKNEEVK